MMNVILGLKGSGKTKKLLDAIHEAMDTTKGDVVCIEYGKQLTYDVNYKVRLVNAKEYGIKNPDLMKGFLSGLHAGNFDITYVFIDNLYKSIGYSLENAEEFVQWCVAFAEKNNMNVTVTISENPANVSEEMKKYVK